MLYGAMLQNPLHSIRCCLIFAALATCLLGLVQPASAAATVFPEKPTGPFRDAATFARLDTELKELIEKTRTMGTANDMVMGHIHDLAAGLRYPLASCDALAVFLDSLPAVAPDASEAVKSLRNTSLQLARVMLNEDSENTRATLRAIRDLRAQEAAHPGPALRDQLLTELENICYAIGAHLYAVNKRGMEPLYTERVKAETLNFLDEPAANAAQESRKAFLDRLATDRDNQDFIGGAIGEKVTALRFPFRIAIRTGFFLERLFEAPSDELARQGALTLAIQVLEREMALASLALGHIQAIAKARADDPIKQRLLQEAANLHQATLHLLSDSLERYRGKTASPKGP